VHLGGGRLGAVGAFLASNPPSPLLFAAPCERQSQTQGEQDIESARDGRNFIILAFLASRGIGQPCHDARNARATHCSTNSLGHRQRNPTVKTFYSTVTLLARLRGWSTSFPRPTPPRRPHLQGQHGQHGLQQRRRIRTHNTSRSAGEWRCRLGGHCDDLTIAGAAPRPG